MIKLNSFGCNSFAKMKHHWRSPKVGLHLIFWRHFNTELSKLQNICRRINRYSPLIIPPQLEKKPSSVSP